MSRFGALEFLRGVGASKYAWRCLITAQLHGHLLDMVPIDKSELTDRNEMNPVCMGSSVSPVCATH